MKKGILSVLFVVAFAFAANAQTNPGVATGSFARGNTARAIFTVNNFSQARFDAIKPSLEKIEGLSFSNTNPSYQEYVFVYDRTKTTAAKIQEVLKSLGQEVTLTKTTEPSKMMD